MKNVFWPAMAAMTVIAAVSVAHAAPADRVFGQVSAVDSTANTITVTSRNFQDPEAAPTTTTLKVTGTTKYTIEVTKTLDSLKVGDNIRVQGRPDDAGNVEARGISLIPAGQPLGGPGGARPGGGAGGRGGRRGTAGTIVTLKPALTIKTADDKTITVTTTADTRVTGPGAGTLADVKADSFISAEVTGDPGSQTATSVQVSNGFGRRGGQGGFGGGQGGRRRGGQGQGSGQGGDAPAQ